MAAPFDTLKLARQFEAAGFDPKQAGDMAAAIAEADATSAVNLATKQDLRELELRLELRLGTLAAAIAGALFAALHLWPPHA